MFYLCKLKQKQVFTPKNCVNIVMKDRIRQVMESQHMSQQVFADFIGIAPATLSGVFNGRTKPTINIVEAIKRKIPAVSVDWLMFGSGSMYSSPASSAGQTGANNAEPLVGGNMGVQETLFDFDAPAPTPSPTVSRPSSYSGGGRIHRPEMEVDFMKNNDKAPRRVTEIRVFYDDQTWESFVPAKK